MEVGNLSDNINNNWMVWCVPMETLKGPERVCTEEETLLRLLPKENKGSIDGKKFTCVNAVVAMQLVGEKLVFTHKKAVC